MLAASPLFNVAQVMAAKLIPFVGLDDTYYMQAQQDGTFIVFGNLWMADQDESYPTEREARARCESLAKV